METEIEAMSFKEMEEGSRCLYESERKSFDQGCNLDEYSPHQPFAGNNAFKHCESIYYGANQYLEDVLYDTLLPSETLS